MIYAGIDNGLEGGLVIMVEGQPIGRFITPTEERVVGKGKAAKNRRDFNDHEMARLLRQFKPDRVFLEVAQPMNRGRTEEGDVIREGSKSAFSTGLGYGVWRGVLAGLGLSYERVPVRRWQTMFFKGLPGSMDTKQAAASVARGLWPDVDWRPTARSKKPHTGLCDAALICEWGRRMTEGVVTDA